MSKISSFFLFTTLIFLASACSSGDLKRAVNYDETKVGSCAIPDPFLCEDGTRVTSESMWWNKRRPELLRLFEEHVYGKTPSRENDTLIFKLLKISHNALGGKAIMKEIDIFFTSKQDTNSMRLLLFVPKTNEKAPCFLSLNFNGNVSVSPDTMISHTNRWMRNKKDIIVNNRTSEATRGSAVSRWPIEMIISHGYALGTIYYGDLDPDYDDGFQNGVHPLFYKEGQTRPDSAEWGAIGAWAWGLSRALDYLETDSLIDAKKTIAIGHSRLGKTALWAAAQDQRFAIAISNNSGCGGAALSKRNFGENAIIINTAFPHWFCDNFTKYNQNECALPVDQHELISLIAPRPVYIASASEDLWADPRGEFLSATLADTVYRFLNTSGFGIKEMPSVDMSYWQTIGYHIREGKHDITAFDWEQYIKFADFHLKK